MAVRHVKNLKASASSFGPFRILPHTCASPRIFPIPSGDLRTFRAKPDNHYSGGPRLFDQTAPSDPRASDNSYNCLRLQSGCLRNDWPPGSCHSFACLSLVHSSSMARQRSDDRNRRRMSDPLARNKAGARQRYVKSFCLPSGQGCMGDVKEKVFGSRQGRPVGYTYILLSLLFGNFLPSRLILTLSSLILSLRLSIHLSPHQVRQSGRPFEASCSSNLIRYPITIGQHGCYQRRRRSVLPGGGQAAQGVVV